MKPNGDLSHHFPPEGPTTELYNLLQEQTELTKREAFVGLTPAEREQYERISARIQEVFMELGKLSPGGRS